MAYMQANVEDYQLFLRWIHHRIKNNKNCLIITVGSTGSGKSYSNLRLATDADDTFDMTRGCFSPEEFMGITDSGTLKKKGAAILYDDAGISLNSKNWYDITNKMINYYLQIARADNQILFFNTPDISFLDSSARKLFHMMLETVGIDYKRKVVRIKPKFLQVNKTSGKVYAKYIIVKRGVGFGSKRKIKVIEVPMPKQNLVDAYEIKKAMFVKRLKKDIMQAISTKNLKELTDRQYTIYNARKMGVDEEEIAKNLNISVRSVYYHEEAIKKKGFELEIDKRLREDFQNQPKSKEKGGTSP